MSVHNACLSEWIKRSFVPCCVLVLWHPDISSKWTTRRGTSSHAQVLASGSVTPPTKIKHLFFVSWWVKKLPCVFLDKLMSSASAGTYNCYPLSCPPESPRPHSHPHRHKFWVGVCRNVTCLDFGHWLGQLQQKSRICGFSFVDDCWSISISLFWYASFLVPSSLLCSLHASGSGSPRCTGTFWLFFIYLFCLLKMMFSLLLKSLSFKVFCHFISWMDSNRT